MSFRTNFSISMQSLNIIYLSTAKKIPQVIKKKNDSINGLRTTSFANKKKKRIICIQFLKWKFSKLNNFKLKVIKIEEMAILFVIKN